MDRVLLLIDDIQYAGHLETTLRKVGFDPETITNEYNLQDQLISFNPDYIIAKGNTARVSSLSIGKKLKENSKYPGKVILIFSEDSKPGLEDLIKLRMDLLLFEPISALRLVAHLLTLTNLDRETIMDKLVRFAHTDPQFRNNEQQILKSMGATIDSEIQIISGSRSEKESSATIDEKDVLTFVQPELKDVIEKEPAPAPETAEDFVISDTYKNQLQSELAAARQELPLRIDSYNRAIRSVDQDLQKGLSKRQTKASNKTLFSEKSVDEMQKQDEERKKFVKALMKK
ncbi:MAG: hypothetical protein H7235_05690 [Bdellovibrionaceae bacterium]|nr:hypothetical protein [Pseudobdellovibrionaceae bacterium]